MAKRIKKRPHSVAGPGMATLIGLLTIASQAEVLVAVDIGKNGQAVEPGYADISMPSKAIFEPRAFAGGTWDIDATPGLALIARNYGNIETSPGGDLLEDSVLVNQNQSDPDLFFELVLDDLAPGAYTLTTYHHSYAFGGATAEVSAGADSAALFVLGTITSSSGTDISSFAVVSVDFTATSEADGYTLRFRPTNAAGSFHFDLSGFELAGTADNDGDGIADGLDNCTETANSEQQDTDTDGIGNACDPDIALPNDCQVNFADLVLLKQSFFATPADANWNADADLTGGPAGEPDDIINFADLQRMKDLFFGQPGPSGVPNVCDGS